MSTPADRLREKANGVRAQAQLFQNERADGDFRWDEIIRLMGEKAILLYLLADAWDVIGIYHYSPSTVPDETCSACSLLARIEEIA